MGLLTGIWAYVIAGIAAVVVIGGATHYADSVYYNGKIDSMKSDYAAQNLARTNAELKQFQDISKQINVAATNFLANQGLLGTKIDIITKDLKDVQVKKPLPRDCVPSVDRVRNLNAAIAAANSSIAGH